MVAIAIKTGASTRAQVTPAPRFKAGDKVVARNINPPTHTRLPRYIRGKHGVVQHNHGGFAFADTRAHIREINRDHPMIVVEHDMSFIRTIARRITVFDRGSILMEGDVAQVFGNQAVRDVYLGKQVAA